ncbi:TonB-dependent receptor [Polynucleobacter asymbioticus]|jgi:iron complex outermembrane receptor protein|uniref:TonB-dependent receptor n=1 Tax=Polynucleobacter asymbioticus TaxID=576611 RepID=UPI001BFE0AFE|nr:TonB-dependent receptor [Polynucleobacter asymbioticus]QWD85713.1 TonB-dependent receptor [Polynucleobacter asymbioticus]
MKQQFSSKTFVTLFCGATLTFNVLAQSAQSTVIVSGSRFQENLNEVPANVKVITRDEIANSSSNNIPEVLSQIGGLNVKNSSGNPLNLDASVDMGGYGATANSNTLVLVDGQRLNPIDSGTINWGSIPIDSIERIEVLQGGASVQYGNGAVGGVINIITNGGVKNLNQASITYGSYNTVIGNAILRNKVNDTTIQLTANSSNTDGWRQNSAANTYSFDGKVTQSLGGIDQVYADIFFNHSNSQTPGAVLGQAGRGNSQSARATFIGSSITTDNSGIRAGFIKAIDEQLTFDIDGTYSNKNTSSNIPAYPYYVLYPNWQLAVAPKIKANFGDWGTTVLGYDFNQASQSSSSGLAFSNVSLQQNVSIQNQSMYLVSRIPLKVIDGLELSGGFRHQAQNASANDLSSGSTVSANQKYSANAGDAAFNYNYQAGQKIFIKWDQSYRFPNTDEFWGFDPSTYQPIFNGILKPQISQTYSAGGDWNLRHTHLSALVFQSITQNEIRYDPSSGSNINTAGNINRTGFLFDSSSNITKNLTLAGGGKIQRSTYTTGSIAGAGVGLAPDILLNARAQYMISSSWSAGAVVNYVGNQNYDADPTITNSLAKIPSYVAADVYASYRVKSWDAKFMIKNIGGNSYATTGGYNSSSGYYYYPTTPTTYFVTAKYNF